MSKGFFSEKSGPAKVLFVLVILYAICAVIFLVLALGIGGLKLNEFYYNPVKLIAFSIVSFFITVLISLYHLITLIKRRKRKTDQH